MNTITFEEVLTENYPRLYRKALSVLHNHYDAEDVVQVACTKAWLHKDDVIATPNYLPWLYKIVYHECISLIRKRSPFYAHNIICEIENIADLTDYYDALLIFLDVNAVIGKMSECLSKPLLLQSFGYSQREIAQLLLIPRGTVASRLSRAREKIKESCACQ